MQTLFCLTRKFTASPNANVTIIVRTTERTERTDNKLIVDVTSLDVYERADIDEDKKSIAIAVTVQPREKTLTDLDIDVIAAQIVAEVSTRTGRILRA